MVDSDPTAPSTDPSKSHPIGIGLSVTAHGIGVWPDWAIEPCDVPQNHRVVCCGIQPEFDDESDYGVICAGSDLHRNSWVTPVKVEGAGTRRTGSIDGY